MPAPMPPPVAGLVSLAEVKAHLNITGTASDVELAGFIDAATEVVEYLCGPIVERAIVGEVHDGGGERLLLRQYPVLEVTAVTYADGTAATVADLDVDSAAGLLRFKPTAYSRFPGAGRWVRVDYKAGRAAVPANVRLGALELLRWWFPRSQRGASLSRLEPGEDAAARIVAGYTVPYFVEGLLKPHLQVVR